MVQREGRSHHGNPHPQGRSRQSDHAQSTSHQPDPPLAEPQRLRHVAHLSHRADMDDPLHAADELPVPHAAVDRFRRVQDEPTDHPVERALHPAAPLLDLVFGEVQPALLHRAHQPDLGHPAARRFGGVAQEIPRRRLGPLRAVVFGRRLPIRPCNVRYAISRSALQGYIPLPIC